MAQFYTIQVQNRTGANQKYALFSEPPKVLGPVQSQIWSNIIETAGTPANQTATFSIGKEVFATCGHSQGRPGDGVSVNVLGNTEVKLGKAMADGSLVPGTTLHMVVQDNSPYFDSNRPEPSGYRGAFAVTTGSDFTTQDAKSNNFLLGVGSSSNGNVVPFSVFTPQPNVQYQLNAINKFYISFGEYTQGALLNATSVGQMVAVDFTKTGPNVTINHTAQGTLLIQQN